MNMTKEKKVKKDVKKNPSVKVEANNNPKLSVVEFSDEEIRIKANEIYNFRMDFGISGSAEEDWQDAISYLSSKLNY
jgi:hypothetical protein